MPSWATPKKRKNTTVWVPTGKITKKDSIAGNPAARNSRRVGAANLLGKQRKDLFERFGGDGRFSDFFDQFFGEGGKFRGGSTARKGRNFKSVLPVSLQDAYLGTPQVFSIDNEKLRVKIKPGIADGQITLDTGQGRTGSRRRRRTGRPRNRNKGGAGPRLYPRRKQPVCISTYRYIRCRAGRHYPNTNARQPCQNKSGSRRAGRQTNRKLADWVCPISITRTKKAILL